MRLFGGREPPRALVPISQVGGIHLPCLTSGFFGEHRTTGLLLMEINNEPAVIASALDDSMIYAFRLNGEEIWKKDYHGHVDVLEEGFLNGEKVILAGVTDTLYSINLEGDPDWSYPISRREIRGNYAAYYLKWGIVSASSGNFGGEESVAVTSIQNGCMLHILDACGSLREVKQIVLDRSPIFNRKEATVGKPIIINSEGLERIVGTTPERNMSRSNYGIRICVVYPDHINSFKGPNLLNSVDFYLDTKDKPRWPFTVGTLGEKSVIVLGNILERDVSAYTLDGKILWKYDTKHISEKNSQWGIADVRIGKLLGKDVVILGGYGGTLVIADTQGKTIWEARLPSNVLNVAYMNHKGKDIYAAGLFNGDVLLFQEGQPNGRGM